VLGTATTRLLPNSLLLVSFSACANSNGLELKSKADRAMVLLNERVEAGCDVSGIVPKMKRVKVLGDAGRLDEANALLDEILLDFAQQKHVPDRPSGAGAFVDDVEVAVGSAK